MHYGNLVMFTIFAELFQLGDGLSVCYISIMILLPHPENILHKESLNYDLLIVIRRIGRAEFFYNY